MNRVAILWNPVNQSAQLYLDQAKSAARTLGIQLQVLEVRQPANFERAFTAMSRERAGALLVIEDGMFILQRTRIVVLPRRRTCRRCTP